jgi:hypothetical protein
MQHFYDGQIRRYLTQTIRVLSNFVVKYGDGTLVRVPVMYGDADRQAASIIRQNSENKVNSAPRISVYITDLKLDRARLSDSTYVGKLHFRERGIDQSTGDYNQSQGRNYTVERIMPTPFALTMKVDIWAANTDQKLQLLEQMLVLFNPSLELQTTDNYIDWTSLTVLNLNDIRWTSRQIPMGNDSPIEVSTLTLDTPIWLSPPAKVKHLGVITKIITSFYQNSDSSPADYIDGLGVDLAGSTVTMSGLLTEMITTITDYGVQVYNNPQGIGSARLLNATESVVPRSPTLDISVKQGGYVHWEDFFKQYPGQFTAGSSRIYLIQPNGFNIVGTMVINPMDSTILNIDWDIDSLSSNTGIDSNGLLDTDNLYNAAASFRANSTGTIDAIINPLTYNPLRPNNETEDQVLVAGTRFLIVEDIGSETNEDGADAWKNTDNTDFVARANDIIEWQDDHWAVIFAANQESDTMIWQTNIYTGVQYLWNGVSWVKSFEGEYKAGQWRVEL